MIDTKWLANPNQGFFVIFLINIIDCMNILFNNKVRNFFLVKWSSSPLPPPPNYFDYRTPSVPKLLSYFMDFVVPKRLHGLYTHLKI